MKINEIIENAKKGLSDMTEKEVNTVVGITKNKEKEWHIMLEILEKKSIPDAMDLLGLYDVLLDEKGNILNFERKKLRKRGDAEMGEILFGL